MVKKDREKDKPWQTMAMRGDGYPFVCVISIIANVMRIKVTIEI